MRTNNNLSQLDNQPLRLTEEERQDPYSVLDDFFSCFHLQDMREMLWDWLVAAMSSESGQYSTGYARSNLVFVYEKLELFIEAVQVINKRRKKRQKQNSRKWKRKEAKSISK
jgi:hypothetical protein